MDIEGNSLQCKNERFVACPVFLTELCFEYQSTSVFGIDIEYKLKYTDLK